MNISRRQPLSGICACRKAKWNWKRFVEALSGGSRRAQERGEEHRSAIGIGGHVAIARKTAQGGWIRLAVQRNQTCPVYLPLLVVTKECSEDLWRS